MTLQRAVAATRAYAALGRGGAPTAAQSAVTLFVLAAMYTVSTVRTGHHDAPGPGLTVAVVAAWAPLLARTYRPALTLLGTLTAESFILVFLTVPDPLLGDSAGMGAYQPVPVATMVAVATLASRIPARLGWTVGAAAGGYLGLLGMVLGSRATFLTDLVVFYLVVTAAAVGVWRSGRRERAAREVRRREAETQQAVLDERLRIARELHDVLAHNLTLVNAQAGVAQYLLRSSPEAADTALRDITRHTARAIDDLRATIGLLRRRDEDAGTAGSGRDAGPGDEPLRPVPTLDDLDALISTFSRTGTRVDLIPTGVPQPLAQHVGLAAYRIVQESLTNAAKHAPDSVVDVALSWSPGGVRIRTSNPLVPVAGREPAPGTGHGLIGMRERAIAVGGTFRAGPSPDGRFEVVATLPARPDAGTDPTGHTP